MSRNPAQQPLVSIIIPNYNHAQYLGAALDSVLAQTYGAYEVILVDDGSTDDSAAVITRYAARFGGSLHPILQANQGLSAARNNGVQAAQGQYIALLDADDLLEPTYLERMVGVLHANPAAQGAYCGFRFVDQTDRPLAQVENRVTTPEALYAALLMGNYWVPESLVAARACYIEMGEFDTSLRACEDWDVWLRFSRSYKLVGIPDVLIRYRVVVGSMSSDPVRMLDNRLTVLGKHVGGEPTQPGGDDCHAAYANAYLRTAVEYWQYGDEAAAYRCLHRAALIHPQLMRQTAIFYELACGSQAKGDRGDVSGLNLDQSGAQVLALVRRLLSEPDLQVTLGGQEARVEASAHVALGMLYYNQRDPAAARRAYLQASRLDPSLWTQRDFLGRLGRSVIGADTAGRLRRAVGSK